ncbi:MAG TPA: DUF255 domain-containing protein [Candidatus Saccharimonadales bacterium]|nr:DUF255 domain-containing protein [Candidatus Saccharimonadales bacterium]
MRPSLATIGALTLCATGVLCAPAALAAGEEPAPQVKAPEPTPVTASFPWMSLGPEAFAKAREENRPILLYISTQWEYLDRTMREATFGDPRVQSLIRDRYVGVRVDTDERPDIFSRYGMGGWPSVAVVLSNGHPFYFPEPSGKSVMRAGGTYFTPEKFLAYFGQLADYWDENRDKVESLSKETDNRVLQHRDSARADLSPKALEVVIGALLDRYGQRSDKAQMGAFLPEFDVSELGFYYWHLKSDHKVLQMALNHLVDLARGGIHDRIGGGFFRASTDSFYRIPSFEKLPSTNADALEAYLHAWQVTRHPAYFALAREILDFEMAHGINPASHSFMGSIAAWSPDGGDGDYYTWTQDELRAILTDEEFKVASEAFDIEPLGEMTETAPRRNVIFMQAGPVIQAQQSGTPAEQVEKVLDSAVAKMLAAREKRPAPPVDTRTYGDWSGRMIRAFLDAAIPLGEPEAASKALEALGILMDHCRTTAGLVAHLCVPDQLKAGDLGFLSDQARVILALLAAYEYTADAHYLTKAEGLAVRASGTFEDVSTGGLTDAIADPNAPGLLAWPYRDLNENMAMDEALLRVGLLAGDDSLVKAGRKAAESWADDFGGVAVHASSFALTSQMYLNPPLEVLVFGADGDSAEAVAARREIMKVYHPWRIVRHVPAVNAASEMQRRGLKPAEGISVAFCVGADCSGPWPVDGSLGKHLGDFLKPGEKDSPAH